MKTKKTNRRLLSLTAMAEICAQQINVYLRDELLEQQAQQRHPQTPEDRRKFRDMVLRLLNT